MLLFRGLVALLTCSAALVANLVIASDLSKAGKEGNTDLWAESMMPVEGMSVPITEDSVRDCLIAQTMGKLREEMTIDPSVNIFVVYPTGSGKYRKLADWFCMYL